MNWEKLDPLIDYLYCQMSLRGHSLILFCSWYILMASKQPPYLVKAITTIADFALLQQDNDSISDWVDKNYLQINVYRCRSMHITRKTKCSQPAPHLTLCGQPRERVNTHKYLGLLLSTDFSWTQHNKVCTKAKKLLALIYCCLYSFSTLASLFQMYISLVCPNLEYTSQVGNPYKVGEVKKFALCMCAKSWDTVKNFFSVVLPTRSPSTQALPGSVHNV